MPHLLLLREYQCLYFNRFLRDVRNLLFHCQLIDVGMISDIGSRYVCWAIFFVLTVSCLLRMLSSTSLENAMRGVGSEKGVS